MSLCSAVRGMLPNRTSVRTSCRTAARMVDFHCGAMFPGRLPEMARAAALYGTDMTWWSGREMRAKKELKTRKRVSGIFRDCFENRQG